MLSMAEQLLRPAAAVNVGVPAWVRRATRERSSDATLIQASIEHATRLDENALRAAVREAYRGAFETAGERHVVRAWNVVPGICDPLGDGERYFAFNAGRHDAMAERFGDALPARAPAASGVGSAGDALTIALLATGEPGVAVENPRQVPACRYSARFGPLPPCFVRAMRATINGQSKLLVSGTASIVGEESRAGDTAAQLAVTLDNLRALADLSRFEHVRVYLPTSTIADDGLRDATRAAFGSADVEFVEAALCRRELLVEIEGVADGSEP